MIRILVAEDSPTVRALLVAILESDPELRVVGQATNGREAVAMALDLRPDLITMDVHMPVMDGLEATKEIMVQVPTPILVVSSTSSQSQIELSLSAQRAGALMVVPTPRNPLAPDYAQHRDRLVAMVKAMAISAPAESAELGYADARFITHSPHRRRPASHWRKPRQIRTKAPAATVPRGCCPGWPAIQAGREGPPGHCTVWA